MQILEVINKGDLCGGGKIVQMKFHNFGLGREARRPNRRSFQPYAYLLASNLSRRTKHLGVRGSISAISQQLETGVDFTFQTPQR